MLDFRTLPSKVELRQTTNMWSLFGQIALEYLYNKYKDPNRDKPPAPIQPVVLQPHTTSSLSAGTACADSVDVMRLNISGQTPHQQELDEMKVDYLKRQYGLIAQIEWKSTDAVGTQITAFVLSASPCMSIKKYGKTSYLGVDCYHLPPVAVLANLYGFWRGSIEYRLDFVCTRFHVGKLWVSFQPNCVTPLTYDQSRACAGVEIDLSEDRRQHTFKCPYLADRPFWPRCYSSGVDKDVQGPPGIIVGYVIAPLTCTDVISDTIELNIYVRGGEDMEFAVPCQPGVGLSFNPKVPSQPGDHIAKPYIEGRIYAPNYVGTWYRFEGGTRAVLRWGTTTDQIAQFSGFEQGYIYQLSPDYQEKWKDSWWVMSGSIKIQLAELWFVPLDVNDGDGYIYCAICQAEDSAKKYWCDYKTATGTWEYRYKDKQKKRGDISPDRDQAMIVTATSENNYSPSLPSGAPDVYILVGKPASGTDPVKNAVRSEAFDDSDDDASSFVMSGDSDERQNAGAIVELLPSPPPTGAEAMYGEKFIDLKDLCRRYQPYWRMQFRAPDKFGMATAIIPAVPTGLSLDNHDNFQSLCRDGIIPIVASGFRFYRGGLRFKILSSWLAPGSIWLQVRPDRRFRGRSPMVAFSSDMDSGFNHGYATAFQSTSVNPTMSIEVPYYQPGEYGLLQMTSDSIYSSQASWSISNGELVVGCVSHPMSEKMEKKVNLTVFYSLADDCRFSVFQGFPPMIPVVDHLS